MQNFDRTLNAFRKRSPYRPFTVVLVNGDRFEVDYPDALVVREGWPFTSVPVVSRLYLTTRG